MAPGIEPRPPKIIAISGAGPGGRRNYLKWAKHLGADEVLAKPFRMSQIVALSNQGPDWAVYFFPASTGRVYALQYRTDLASGAWTNLQDQTPVSGTGAAMFLSDTNAAGTRFYRVNVEVP